jgi:hypothetical protein
MLVQVVYLVTTVLWRVIVHRCENLKPHTGIKSFGLARILKIYFLFCHYAISIFSENKEQERNQKIMFSCEGTSISNAFPAPKKFALSDTNLRVTSLRLRDRFVSCRVGLCRDGCSRPTVTRTASGWAVLVCFTMDCEKLAYCVFERRALWDHRDKMYYNREVKRKLWSEVAELMGSNCTCVWIIDRFVGY